MKKKLCLIVGAFALFSAPLVSAQQEIDDLVAGLNAFVEKTPPSLPMAAGAGIDWSTAYIGTLLSADFPFIHLGAGAQIGATSISPDAVNPLLATFGQEPLEAMFIPFVVANARVGGLILPFDVGLKAGFLPEQLATSVPDTKFVYQNFGVDLRYNLVKSNLLLPDISVGAGVSALKMGVERVMGASQVISEPVTTDDIYFGAPTAMLSLEAVSFDAKIQISKQLLFILTPYVGATVSMGSGKASSGISATVIPNYNGDNSTYITADDWSQLTGKTITATGITNAAESAAIGLKVFGGASLNLLLLYVDVQGMYSPIDGGLGGSIGVRAQL